MTTPNSGYAYQLGATGNKTSATELTGRTVNWTYNGVYQLTNEAINSDPTGENGSVAYGLDPVGNRLSASSTITNVMSSVLSYNLDDQLNSETYDANGNATQVGTKSFTYDSENRLTTMNGGAVTILYDGDGNRVAEAVSGVTTKYLIDNLNPTGYAQVLDELIGGSVQREYAYGLQRIDERQIVSGTWTPSFYGYDGGGSVRQLTNLSGAVTATYEYDAFGYLLSHAGSTLNNYLYRGEEYDSSLSLYYLRARYYNPSTGRFLSRDPYDGNKILPISLHKYLYAGSNPVNYVDPRGREAMFEYVIQSNAAIPEAKLISIYGCVADAALAAVDLILDESIGYSNALSTGSAILGCVVLMPGLNDLAEAGIKVAKITKGSLEFISTASGWGACALDAEDFVNALNSVLSGSPNGDEIGKSIEALGGCVGDALGAMLKAEATE